MEIDLEGLKARFPRALLPEEEARLKFLVEDAVDLIRMEFARRARDVDREVAETPWLRSAVNAAVRQMVNAAILVGQHVGVRSVSSTTGPQSDSITYADVDAASWGGVLLNDALREMLGLKGQGARGSFPTPLRWPERRVPGRSGRWL